MSLIQQSSEPEKVAFEDLRMGDLIRVAKVDDARHNLQFVVTELDDLNVGGSFGDWEILIPNLNTWAFYMVEEGPRVTNEYTLGWLTVQHEQGNWGPTTILGYWRTNSTGSGEFVEGVTAGADGVAHPKYPFSQVKRFTTAYLSSTNPMDEPVQWTTTPPTVPTAPYPYIINGPTCGHQCRGDGSCGGCF